jgi:nicotinate-nucleotide--dimethylbenzimidazole phosphoribosyltransferase
MSFHDAGRFEAVFFDVGNTLVEQANPGTPVSELRTVVLPGVHQAIEKLRTVTRLGIVSNTTVMTEQDLRSLLSTEGLSSCFELVVATADLGVHKPSPLPLLHAASVMGVDASRCLYVGDIESDAIAAHAAGMEFCYTGPDLEWALLRYFAEPTNALTRAVHHVSEPEVEFGLSLQEHLNQLVKPVGSLGSLEVLASHLASTQRHRFPRADPAAVAIFCGDHGIAADNTVTPWPQEITWQMSAVIASGKAASSIFATSTNTYLEIVDVGLVGPKGVDGVRPERIRSGTDDLRSGMVMSVENARRAFEVGAETAERLVAGGTRLLCVGEVGMGNTTIAACLIAYYTRSAARLVTGRGAGIDDATLDRKKRIVEEAVNKVPAGLNVFDVVSRIGGLEIAAMAGFIVAASSLRVPVILDGVITLSAACLARELAPWSIKSCIASHCSSEPAAEVALQYLGLEAMFNFGLRLGEGTGALLAVPILRAVCDAVTSMASLSDLT